MPHPIKHILPLVLVLFLPLCSLPVNAQIDLEVLTTHSELQAFIYNSADLTLIKDTRTLPLAKGMNQIRFSWAGTRIDPTSLSLDIRDGSVPVKITQMQFAPDADNQVRWHILADQACLATVDIRYFTAGIFWQSHYTAFLSSDRSRMHLTGHVRTENRSGLDYPDARIFLVVGKIHLLDRIAALADRQYPYGRPDMLSGEGPVQDTMARGKALLESAPAAMMHKSMAPAAAPRQIEKTGVSEYFVYAVEGRETLADGWARQLIFVDVPSIPVDTIHVFDSKRFNDQVIQMVSFTNDTASGPGSVVPLPGGAFKVFQQIDSSGGLTLAGTDTIDYIPTGSKHRLNLGADPRVTVVPKIMAYTKTNLTFDKHKNLSGFDEVRKMALNLANFSDQPVRIEIVRHLPNPDFNITGITGQDGFEKIDQNRFKLLATLSPGSRKTIQYTLTMYKGDRKWQHTPVPSS
jgi:hypothetical protein